MTLYQHILLTEFCIATTLFLTIIGFMITGTDASIIVFQAYFVVVWVLRKFYLQTWRQIRLLDLKAKALLYDSVNETVAGLEHIRSFAQQAHAMQSFYDCLDCSQRVHLSLLTIKRWLYIVTEILGLVLIAIMLSTTVRTRAASPSGLGLAMLNMTNIGALTRSTIEKWGTWEIFVGAVVRLRDFERKAATQKDTGGAHNPPPSWPTHGSVEFQSVTASYQSASDRVSPALERVSAIFNAGQRVLITGHAGRYVNIYFHDVIAF